MRTPESEVPTQLSQYRVFIASPGGLEVEREAFRKALVEYSESESSARGATFLPVGWELTLRGVGRPQAQINDEVRKCDYFVLLLWDRWGSPPDNGGKYSSGTEEEYDVAWECLKSTPNPMRQIIVLFKTVNPRQQSDPGPQLQAVLAFKKKLEAEKILFYDTFDEVDSFVEKVRRYLAHWTRGHEAGDLSKASLTPGSIPAPTAPVADSNGHVEEPASDESEFLRDVRSLLVEGKLTDAEAKLVQAVVPGNDLAAFNAYGQFLVRQGRLTDAEAVFRRMLIVTEEAGAISWAGAAYAGLGGVFRMRPDFLQAHAAMKKAVELKKKAGDIRGTAQVLVWFGDTCSQLGHPDLARTYYREALELLDQLPPKRPQVDVRFKLAKVCLRLEDVAAATELAEELERRYEQIGDPGATQAFRAWMKVLRKKAGPPAPTNGRKTSPGSKGIG